MNITLPRAVIEQALEALVAAYQGKDKTNQVTESITALRTVLEQPEQEPVWWMLKTGHGTQFKEQLTDELKALTWKGKPMWTPLYDSPPQRKPLTDEEIILIVAECAASHQHTDIHFARAIERAHGIKELV